MTTRTKKMLQRIVCDNREDWLQARRQQGIGGSEAAAAIGMSPWKTPLQLWREKLGIEQPKDLSGNAAVEQGVQMEPILRDFYMACHPEYTLEYRPYDILYQAEYPWLFATLDGELLDSDGRHGVFECKTATPKGKAGWDEWNNGHLPSHYMIQVCHQLLATGYEFVRLFACLYSLDGTKTLKEYEIEREDVLDDLDWLLHEEERFMRYITTGMMPPMPLSL